MERFIKHQRRQRTKEWEHSNCGLVDEARAYWMAGMYETYGESIQIAIRCFFKKRMELAEAEIIQHIKESAHV